jgi:hypothetical protein
LDRIIICIGNVVGYFTVDFVLEVCYNQIWVYGWRDEALLGFRCGLSWMSKHQELLVFEASLGADDWLTVSIFG